MNPSTLISVLAIICFFAAGFLIEAGKISLGTPVFGVGLIIVECIADALRRNL